MRSEWNALFCRALFALFGAGTLSSCAHKTITFAAAGPAKVSTVSADNLAKDGILLGETPLTVKVDQIRGKIVKISQKGKIPIYWVMPDVAGENIRANLNLVDEPQAPADGVATQDKPDKNGAPTAKLTDSKATINRVMRLLLKAYQALASKRLQLADELASRASTIDPEIAAPLVIKGIALMQSGDQAGARAALSNARALDPEDQDIEILLKAIR